MLTGGQPTSIVAAGSAASQNPALAAAVGQGGYPMHGSPMPPQGPQVQASTMSQGSPAPPTPAATSSTVQTTQSLHQAPLSIGSTGGLALCSGAKDCSSSPPNQVSGEGMETGEGKPPASPLPSSTACAPTSGLPQSDQCCSEEQQQQLTPQADSQSNNISQPSSLEQETQASSIQLPATQTQTIPPLVPLPDQGEGQAASSTRSLRGLLQRSFAICLILPLTCLFMHPGNPTAWPSVLLYLLVGFCGRKFQMAK